MNSPPLLGWAALRSERLHLPPAFQSLLPLVLCQPPGQGSCKGASSEGVTLLNALIPNCCPKRSLSWGPAQ